MSNFIAIQIDSFSNFVLWFADFLTITIYIQIEYE